MDEELKKEPIQAKTLVEHIEDLVAIKRKVVVTERDLKDYRWEMDEAKNTVLTTELCERNVKTMLDLPDHLFYEQEDGAVLELRAADSEAVSVVYDNETAKKIKEFEDTIEAIKKEIEIAKLSGKKTVEKQPVRTWQVWLKEPKNEEEKKAIKRRMESKPKPKKKKKE